MSQTLSGRSDEVERGYAIEADGLKVLRALSDTEWDALGAELGARTQGLLWAIGDWLVVGGIMGPYGTKWKRAMTLTGESRDYLWRCHRVATAYPQSKRVSGATFSQHEQALAVRDDLRLALLRRKVAGDWTTAQWQAALHGEPRERPEQAAQRRTEHAVRRAAAHQVDAQKDDIVVGVDCPHCRQFIADAVLATLPRKERS